MDLHGNKERIKYVTKAIKCISKPWLTKLAEVCSDKVVREQAPPEVDHRQHDEPYKSKFQDAWEEEMRKSDALEKFVRITDLVTHIFKETKNAYKGTKYEKT